MKKAFTLAEVVLTLVIIGILASMTIPSIISSTNKQELKTNLKAATSIVYGAFNRLKADNGFNNDNDKALSDYYPSLGGDGSQFAQDMVKYMNVSKTCGAWGCVNSSGNLIGTSEVYKDFQGGLFATTSNMHYIGCYQYILSNGMIIFFAHTGAVGGIGLSVDVNGYKKPNTVGKDVFGFGMNWSPLTPGTNRLMPVNTLYANISPCNTANANTSLMGCPAAALSDDNYWDLWK